MSTGAFLMLAELKFVQGAVAKKGLVQSLTHFRIENGTVRSFNGSLALCSPIDLDIDCTPKAEPFFKAIQNCKDTVTMAITPAGRLSIKSGSFKAFIQTIEEDETPHVVPEGKLFDIDGDALLKALKLVEPFIGNDASRPWSTGVLLKGQSAFATNNVSIIEYWVGSTFPIVCNVPRAAIREMLRINEPPLQAQVNEQSISFLYSDGKWIRTALLETEWPDIDKLLSVPADATAIDERIYEGLDTLKPFTDKMERIYIQDGVMRTTLTEGEGASFEIPDFPYEGVYQLRILNLLKGVATSIDFTLYPKPCIFYGERLRGAIIGMKV
jgi:DNA polymerase III sliding clamp (beta) subunit (PCNA family)